MSTKTMQILGTLNKKQSVAQDVAPDDTNVLWIDTSDNTIDASVILCDVAQGLSDEQKAQARTNISAQEILTFDATPTADSTNPVTSGGVYTALEGKAPSSHVDDMAKHITADERTDWNSKAPSTHASQHASGGSDPITPESIGAVPTSRMVNGKNLSVDVTLSASDIKALSYNSAQALTDAQKIQAKNNIGINPSRSYQNVLIYGDSFTLGYGLDNQENENWATKFANIIGAKNLYRYSNSGAGFIQISHVSGLNFKDYFDQEVWPLVEGVADIIDLVVIQGGYNDQSQTQADEYTATKSFLQDVCEKFQNAQVVGLTGLTYSAPYVQTLTGINMAFEEMGLYNTKLAYSWIFGQNGYLQTDYVHPNSLGTTHIANKFASALHGGNEYHIFGEYQEANGIGISTRMTPYYIEYIIGGSLSSTDYNTNITTLPPYAAPVIYTSMPCFYEGGYLSGLTGYINIDSTGVLSFFNPTQGTNVGLIRAAFMLGFPFQ